MDVKELKERRIQLELTLTESIAAHITEFEKAVGITVLEFDVESTTHRSLGGSSELIILGTKIRLDI